ncbi:unnamed protein product [Medioppia subpectinata]|uniref:DUF4211 domain-containing protein n=1 Tax=Medioppia subpectinata TaxID=1979941 RepID=A0A7R9PUV6_9ACAR|nr:unnamed protein product [Medioppia subpectinata]CAG2101996.1 unnamed protein product [Medioppia subpectinata]
MVRSKCWMFTGNKKKTKSSKKSKKKDRNKNNNNNNANNISGMSVDPNNAFTGYQYPNQQQYQNTYHNSNPYLMPQSIGHHNQTPQESQQTHNVIPNDTNGDNSHTNANSCYDMQYQHLTQQVSQQQQQQSQQQQQQQLSSHTTQPEHDLMQQLPHEPLHQTVQQTQEHQMMEPVMSMVSQQQQVVNCVCVRLNHLLFVSKGCLPNMNNTSVQLETQSPLVINQTSNICSDRSNAANLSPNNSNHGNSNSSQPSGYLKSYMTFINSPNPQSLLKEKKKKKLKESNENKIKQNHNTVNGQKSSKHKKPKHEDSYECNDEELSDFDHKKNNFSAINENTPKFMSGENIGLKKSTTGDRENYESKFFKRRPSTNINTNNVHIIEMESRKEVKNGKKRKNKFDFNMFSNDSQQKHDEYEFPDSPPNTHSMKKSRKSSTSDNSSKKKTTAEFEKITSPSVNINIKKNTNKKSVTTNVPNAVKPNLTTSSTESIEISINSVALNTGLTQTNDNQSEQLVQPILCPETVKVEPMVNTSSQSVPNPPVVNNKKPNSSSNQTNNKKQTQNQSINRKSPNVKTSPTTATPLNTSTVAIEHILSPVQTTPISNNINNTIISMSTSSTTTTTPPTPTTTSSAPIVTNNCNSNQLSVGMQSAGTNTPRRRSQDKKASTIREGMMRTGDFVVSIDESQYDLPVIWRIEGKSLLQRFEPQEQEDITVYINTSSYSAWNPTVRQRYTGVDVRVMGCSRTRIVVEKLGLTQANPNTVNGLASIERVGANNKANASQMTPNNSFHNQENFEVFIQTLISQALDPNFISEIVKENDDYFLSHVQAIDDMCSRKKSRFFSKIKWDANIVKCVETYPLFTVTAQNNVGDLRCRLCHDNWSTQIMQFNGEPYNQMTLEPQLGVDLKQTKYAACDPCTEKIVLYSHLHHQKNNFFSKCKSKVDSIRGGDESKESHVILELCLQDSDWINTLFKELEEIWNGGVVDARGQKVGFYPEVPEVLKTLFSMGYTIGIASRTSAPEDAEELLSLFDWNKYITYKQIYPGCKTTHFNRIRKESGVQLSQMLFFDDESRNIKDLKAVGVTSILVNKGVDKVVINEGIKQFVTEKQ